MPTSCGRALPAILLVACAATHRPAARVAPIRDATPPQRPAVAQPAPAAPPEDPDTVCRDAPSIPAPYTEGGPSEERHVYTVAVDGWSALPHRPIAALIARNAWIDFREPAFILYEDGVVIWRTSSGTRSGKLDADEVARFVGATLAAGFMDLPDYANFSPGTSDLPSVDMFFRGKNGRWKFGHYEGVYGPCTAVGAPPPFNAIAVAYRAMARPDPRSSEPWSPEHLRVVLTDCDQAHDGATPWPADVPRPTADLHELAPGTERMRMLGSYEHIVAGTHAARLQALFAAAPGRPVQIGDAACTVDVLREFPGEKYLDAISACAWARRGTDRWPPPPVPAGCH